MTTTKKMGGETRTPSSSATMVDALSTECPVDALLSISRESEARALALAKELTASLGAGGGEDDDDNDEENEGIKDQAERRRRNHHHRSSPRTKSNKSVDHHNDHKFSDPKKQGKYPRGDFPIPLPRSLQQPASSQSTTSSKRSTTTASRLRPPSSSSSDGPKYPILETPTASADSILSSLDKIAKEGSRASSEMRQLETLREEMDEEADDLQAALQLRRHAALMEDAARGGRWGECARAVAAYRSVEPTPRALNLAGMKAIETYTEIEVGLTSELLNRYEMAVQRGDIRALSDMTPLLGLLQLAHKGVGMYMRFLDAELEKLIAEATGVSVAGQQQQQQQTMTHEQQGTGSGGLSGTGDGAKAGSTTTTTGAAQASAAATASSAGSSPIRAAIAVARRRQEIPVTTKLAKIYNGGVTLLRHHLPMVAVALGEADGDVELVKLVHSRVQNATVDVLKSYSRSKQMDAVFQRAERVSNAVMEKYVAGHGEEYQDDVVATASNAILAVTGGILQTDGTGGGSDGKKMGGSAHGSSTAAGGGAGVNFVPEDDCGFTLSMGSLGDVDSFMDETALCMQHTESYERFVRHAVEEVGRAKELRQNQKKAAEEEARRRASQHISGGEGDEEKEEEANRKRIEDEAREASERAMKELRLMAVHSSLDEIASEMGGHYAGIERCLLLASMQRAFAKSFHVSGPAAEKNYTFCINLSEGKDGSAGDVVPGALVSSSSVMLRHAGSLALQTLLVEECLYASRRSTLRAFATGHGGTACAMANYTVDALGRALLEVTVRKTEMSTVALRPGEGLLVGQGGRLSQAAMSALRGVSANVTRKASGAVGSASSSHGVGSAGGGVADGNDEREMRRRVAVGVARACAAYNDMEVAVRYVSQLEEEFLAEIQRSFPPEGALTEQLRMCVRSLDSVRDSYKEASNRAISEQLVSQVLPRVRSIVNDAVGQESAAASAFGAMSGSVVGGISNIGGGGMGGVVGGSSGVGNVVKMNYDLDEDAYELTQVGEGYMERLCANLDELLDPLRVHLVPRLADALILGAIRGACKRVEVAIRRTQFTALGALSLDSDVRYLLNFTKERLHSTDYSSTIGVHNACTPLARLSQISLLMNVDDLEDVLDLISSMKRKGQWDLKDDDVTTFLNLRVDFEGRKVNELLRISDGEDEG